MKGFHTSSESNFNCCSKVTYLLETFKDVMLEDFSDDLSPLRDIQHAIDLALG